MSLFSADDLYEAWDALDAQGAVVHRIPIVELDGWEVHLLADHERRRVRALAERHLPAPAPYDWRARWAYRLPLDIPAPPPAPVQLALMPAPMLVQREAA